MLNSVHLQMHNISAHEVAELRGFFSTAFAHLKSLRPPSEVEAENKLQGELDSRYAWMLKPPLPTSLRDDVVGQRRQPIPQTSRGGRVYDVTEDESIQTNYGDESSLYPGEGITGEGRGQPRKSNVSDSGYYSGPQAGRSASPQEERQATRPAQPNSSDANRPPRFAVDDEDE